MFTGASRGEAACPPMYGAAGNVAREGLRFRGGSRSWDGRGDGNVAREGERFRGDARSWDGRGDRNVAREGVCFRGGARSWDGRGDGNVAQEGALSPCAARPDKGRANPAHGVRRGLHRKLCARKCGVYPKHGPSVRPVRHFPSVSKTRRTGRGVVFLEGMPRGDAASISA